ncbi:3407_t:CDS:2 [Acaulospora morrowiae]|uniref:3407_t:CDS:1 n=1 Tax=Acaulospora morrowiae TaxID=94023 RepID=A0A9N8YYH1_9GLOM|nr:3407_t:CDS:2 [Acaulospora morrowiae]
MLEKKDWLNNATEGHYIKVFCYEKFSKIKQIGEGGFGEEESCDSSHCGLSDAIYKINSAGNAKSHTNLKHGAHDEDIKSSKPVKSCKQIFERFNEIYNDYWSSMDKPTKCLSYCHVPFNDVEGILWHLEHEFFEDEEEKYWSNINLQNIPPYFGYRKKEIILIFEAFKAHKVGINILHLFPYYIFYSFGILASDAIKEVENFLPWLTENYGDINKIKCHDNKYYLYGVLDYFSSYFRKKNCGYCLAHQIILIFLRNGFDPNNKYSLLLPNLLFYAINRKYPVFIIELILEYHVDLKILNENGHDALLFASLRKRIEILEHLVKKNCSFLDYRSKIKLLHPFFLFEIISKDYPIPTIEFFIEQGIVDLSVKKDNLNVLSFAVNLKRSDIMKFLLENYPELSEEESLTSALTQAGYWGQERSYLKSWQGLEGENKRFKLMLKKLGKLS